MHRKTQLYIHMKKIIVSGIQPTGNLHLGNYLGAIKQWKELEKARKYKCLFVVMDLHAMTSESDMKIIRQRTEVTRNILEKFVCFKSIFIQSEIYGHGSCFGRGDEIPNFFQIYQRLMCMTSIGQLNRMTQFKEKSDKNNQNLGLFSYPVLMAADILALEADLVPIGEDQKQHLELARDLAKKLGLKVPEPLISESCGRIMSLTDPTKKMSKSNPNDNSRINLSDDAETIRKKIKKAVTTIDGKLNLQIIYNACGGNPILNWNEASKAKEIVADQIIKELCK